MANSSKSEEVLLKQPWLLLEIMKKKTTLLGLIATRHVISSAVIESRSIDRFWRDHNNHEEPSKQELINPCTQLTYVLKSYSCDCEIVSLFGISAKYHHVLPFHLPCLWVEKSYVFSQESFCLFRLPRPCELKRDLGRVSMVTFLCESHQARRQRHFKCKWLTEVSEEEVKRGSQWFKKLLSIRLEWRHTVIVKETRQRKKFLKLKKYIAYIYRCKKYWYLAGLPQ